MGEFSKPKVLIDQEEYQFLKETERAYQEEWNGNPPKLSKSKKKLKAQVEVLEDKLSQSEKAYTAVRDNLHLLVTDPNSPGAQRVVELIKEQARFNDAQDSVLMAGSPSTNLNNVGLAGMVDISAGVASEPPKPKSILEGKVAIQVGNEREFKLLMEHYQTKDWKWCNGRSPLRPINNIEFPTTIFYGDDFYWNIIDGTREVSFPAFAAEVGIEVTKAIWRSEDGVDLFEGDSYHRAYFFDNETYKEPTLKTGWIYDQCCNLNPAHAVMTGVDKAKAFSTKETAEAWIAEQNKPKEVEVKLFNNRTATISSDSILITKDGYTVKLWPSDLEDISHALKSL